jgi:hypothetical protein
MSNGRTFDEKGDTDDEEERGGEKTRRVLLHVNWLFTVRRRWHYCLEISSVGNN